jgi:GntR family transcriptional regulator
MGTMEAKLAVQPPINRLTAAAPLYYQIAASLRDQIESGKLVPGSRLPPERELSELLGVNRMTLRQALQVLEGQGLLIRRQGDGTYVSDPKIERQAGRLFSFTRGMERRGFKPGAKVIAFTQRPVEPYIAVHLKLPVSAPVYDILRLRSINEEPVMLERYTIAVARFPDLDQHDSTDRSLYEILEKEYGVSITQARQSLEPVIAAEYEAALLGIGPGAPLMLERRISFDRNNQPVEYGKDLYRGDRFRFVTEIASLEL